LFSALKVTCGTSKPTADLTLIVNGKSKNVVVDGSGPVDAIFKAIKMLVPHDAKLKLYQVHAVTQGTDAQAEVTVRLIDGTRIVNGHGSDTDTLVASAKAYIDALCRMQTSPKDVADITSVDDVAAAENLTQAK